MMSIPLIAFSPNNIGIDESSTAGTKLNLLIIYDDHIPHI